MNSSSASHRVLRGGGFGSGAAALRAGYRNDFDPSFAYYFLGLRCARSSH